MAEQRQVDRQRQIELRWEQVRAEAERSSRAEIERLEAMLVRMDRTKHSTSVRNMATRLGTARHMLRQSLVLSTWRAQLREADPQRYAAIRAEIEND